MLLYVHSCMCVLLCCEVMSACVSWSSHTSQHVLCALYGYCIHSLLLGSRHVLSVITSIVPWEGHVAVCEYPVHTSWTTNFIWNIFRLNFASLPTQYIHCFKSVVYFDCTYCMPGEERHSPAETLRWRFGYCHSESQLIVYWFAKILYSVVNKGCYWQLYSRYTTILPQTLLPLSGWKQAHTCSPWAWSALWALCTHSLWQPTSIPTQRTDTTLKFAVSPSPWQPATNSAPGPHEANQSPRTQSTKQSSRPKVCQGVAQHSPDSARAQWPLHQEEQYTVYSGANSRGVGGIPG